MCIIAIIGQLSYKTSIQSPCAFHNHLYCVLLSLYLGCFCCQTAERAQHGDLFTPDRRDPLSKTSNNYCEAAV